MTVRRALLIGVPNCDDTAFSTITQVVETDIQKMRSALALSSYDIEALGEDSRSPEPSGSRIRAAIKKACAEAPRGSVLLLYFSGHGVNVDGRDYLVPSDAYREPGATIPDLDSLVPAIPDLRRCQARLVVFFIDACRDTPAGSRIEGAQGGAIHFPGSGSLVMVAGCGPGQLCHYGEDGSSFSQTLARVLDRRNPARTLSGVLTEVIQEMRRKANPGDGRAQLPEAYPQAMLLAAGNTVICEGDELTSAWRRVAEDNALWTLCPAASEGDRAKVRNVVDACARSHVAATDYLLQKTGMIDNWFDLGYPGRVISFTSTLLGAEVRLNPDQAAILIAAPFLREAVLAASLRMAADVRPGDFERSYEVGERTDLELTHEMYPQVIRRAEGLKQRGRKEAHDDLALWLLHRWLGNRASLWQSQAAGIEYERGAGLLTDWTLRLSQAEQRTLVETLLRAVGAEPRNPQLEERLKNPSLPDDWRGLSAILWLAGTLAADPRRMSAVIADHIGTGLELPLTSVKSAADRFGTSKHKDVLDLELICVHPAQHAAFVALTKAAQTVLDEIPGFGGTGQTGDTLPVRITYSGIRPDQPRAESGPAYKVPLTRFRLSEDKVRELLMGRQLYDDPSLAIRELYQNALDACRYRDIRLEALRRRGKDPSPWDGRVMFRQGSEDGREYIECEDNGVGMDSDVLEHVFANAGERFVYRQEYRAEHAIWQCLNPPLRLVSNSQFGIGVFSYFMIADEILLVTRPVDTKGIPSHEAFTVRIASSGSMIQVTPSDAMLGGGTRIRLYLTGDDDERVSVLQTLRKLLWIADYRVVASEHDSVEEEWQPKVLRYQDESAESLEHDRDLWWVSGEGGLVADGIRTNEEIYGLVVNLRDAHRPQFTVDRKKLRSWDKDWVNEKIDKSLPQLMEWPGLSLSWLWEVTNSAPEVAQRIFEHLVKTDTPLLVGGTRAKSGTVRAAEIGCLPYDKELLDSSNWNRYFARWYSSWRTGVWMELANSQRGHRRIPPVVSHRGFPMVDPIDGALLGGLKWYHREDAVWVDKILEAIAQPEQQAADLLRRLRKFAITELNLTELRRCPPLSRTFEKEEKPLLRALAAWTPPGQPTPLLVAGWLVKTSSQLDKPLGEVLRLAEELAPEGWIAPLLDLGTLADKICTAAEVKLVSVELDGQPPWVQGDLQPDHIAHASSELGRDIEQVLEMCDRLSPLGITVAARDHYPESFAPVEAEALRHVRAVGDRLTAMHIVLIAGWAEISVQQTLAELSELERRGLLRLPEIPPTTDIRPDGETLRLINIAMMNFRRSTNRWSISPRRPCLALAAARTGRYFRGGLVNQAAMLTPLTAPETEVTFPELISLASQFFGTIGEARQLLLDAYPAVRLPAETEQSNQLHPWMIESYLISNRWSWRVTDWTLGPGEIIRGAHELGKTVAEFLFLLAPYRRLGAPVPDPDPEVIADLTNWHPDPYDVDLLALYDMNDEAEDFLTEVDALRLVQLAGRLGLTLAETHRRLARMVSLGLRLDYPILDVPDEIVYWQDLLLLTAYRDGQAPSLGGEVSTGHLATVAEETGESIEWLTARLRLYVTLFTLRLPTESADV
ncbi:HD domain-containing protein [Acrocarpospora pleiomorpha]|uniref:HD domain-containing protein n=1 Tax=Acrocarpospora pleiomorpha TaxID=90975 RepID=UPI001478D1D4|nr:caspase family protein [Acrocarpospora pleiomorpha]